MISKGSVVKPAVTGISVRWALPIVCCVLAQAAPLDGMPGEAAGAQWQSSWVELDQVTAFKRGDKLRFRLGGSAQNVVVRLLPPDRDPGEAVGIEGDIHSVPANRILDVKLGSDHPRVTQISVHAGREAWGRSLDERNGRVRLISVERLP